MFRYFRAFRDPPLFALLSRGSWLKAMPKKRLDQLLLDKSLVLSRNEAQALVMRGEVLIDEVPVLKPGTKVAENSNIRIKSERSLFVSRGGDKLLGALSQFEISVEGVVALDVGASTGGFTDCLLQNGAKLVYAVDVGYGQLAEKLRKDKRVIVHEKVHARDIASLELTPAPNFLVMDLSFIGLSKVLAQVLPVLDQPFRMLLLVKPQFELEKADISKGGVVREEKKQLNAVQKVCELLEKELGAKVIAHAPSVLRGEKKGNQEYFVYATL